MCCYTHNLYRDAKNFTTVVFKISTSFILLYIKFHIKNYCKHFCILVPDVELSGVRKGQRNVINV